LGAEPERRRCRRRSLPPQSTPLLLFQASMRSFESLSQKLKDWIFCVECVLYSEGKSGG